MIAHTIGVMRLATSDWKARLMLMVGLLLGMLQFTVYTSWGIHREFEIYSVGIIWHIMQAGLLFVLLIWIDKEDIEHIKESDQ